MSSTLVDYADYYDKSSNMIMDVGKKCNLKFCGTIDYLPWLCKLCDKYYCLEHKTPKDHECSGLKIMEPIAKPSQQNIKKMHPKYLKCYNPKCSNLIENTVLNLMISKCKKCEKNRCSDCRIYPCH